MPFDVQRRVGMRAAWAATVGIAGAGLAAGCGDHHRVDAPAAAVDVPSPVEFPSSATLPAARRSAARPEFREQTAEGVVIVKLDLVDTTRPTAATRTSAQLPTRTLVTTVYLPPTSTPAPLVVLAHGAAGSPEKFTDLADYWAGRGYVVAVPRFPLTNDTIVPPVLEDFVEQARDVRFVVEEVMTLSAGPGELGGRVDAERVGLYGLSLGSMSVWTEVADPSSDIVVDAIIQSDGITLLDDALLGAVAFPVFVAHSDVDHVFLYGDVLGRYDHLAGQKYLLTLHGAVHATVAENTTTPADEVYRQATTAFWDRTLGGAATAPFPADIAGVTTLVQGARPGADPLPGTR